MTYRRWSFGLSLTIDPGMCSRCRYDRDDGRHLPVSECPSCPDVAAHHPFRRRLIPVRIKREYTW